MKIRIPLKFKKKINDNFISVPFFEEIKSTTDNDTATITIEGLVNLLKEKKSFLLSQDVAKYVRFVKFDKNVIFVNFENGYPKEIIKNINTFFYENKYKLKVEYCNESGEDTLDQKKKLLFNKQLEEISKNPIFKEVLECFPNSVIENIENL